jgi:hypothetical protein
MSVLGLQDKFFIAKSCIIKTAWCSLVLELKSPEVEKKMDEGLER